MKEICLRFVLVVFLLFMLSLSPSRLHYPVRELMGYWEVTISGAHFGSKMVLSFLVGSLLKRWVGILLD